jgi:hypothetical protein
MLGINLFDNVDAVKTVTVKVPSTANDWNSILGNYTGNDTTPNWGNGFRGEGWTGSSVANSSYINENITLTIETYTP